MRRAAGPPAFEGVLFDMDGLLIDSERAIMAAWMHAADEAGVALPLAQYIAVVGRNGPESDAVLARVFGGREALRTAQAAVDRTLARIAPEERFPLKAGARELLESLAARGVPCAVASSSARTQIESRLAAAGVLQHFRALAGGDEVHAGKPDAAVYHLAAGRLGVPATRCLAFEDSHNGGLAALAAGATVVLVPDLVRPADELVPRCLRVLATLGEALPFVDDWFPGPRD
jgi:HAD superfamily hydrolase (TIGR01509 family)